MSASTLSIQQAVDKAYTPISDYFSLLEKLQLSLPDGASDFPVFVIGELGMILMEEAERRLDALLEKMEGDS